MSKLISFSIAFSSERLSPAVLLERLLKSGFSNFLSPKAGKVVVDKSPLEFGMMNSLSHGEQFPGEQVIIPGVTSLTDYPDATQEIIDFLKQSSQPGKVAAEFFGDTKLEYVVGSNILQKGISRCGSDNLYLPVVWCYISQFNSTLIGLVAPCPWFFLKYWWPESNHPRYSTPETAEHNWNSLIDAVQSIINVADVDALQETGLTLEGSTVYEEKDWLIAKAQRLPKLIVNFA
jgi:hypothetical protein